MKNYETTLPENYREDFIIDAENKKTIILLNIVGLLLLFAVLLPLLSWLKRQSGAAAGQLFNLDLLQYFALLVILIAYIFAHELTHGAAYHFLTHEKLTYGLTPAAAYCGVPDIYVYKKPLLIAVLAPFVVFDIVFVLCILFFPAAWKSAFALILSIHVSGCIGDLYVSILLIFRYRGRPDLLVNDTGPKQTFYLPENEKA